MSMNLLNISKEIKKINSTLDYLKNQNNAILHDYSQTRELSSITDEIKNNISDIHKKLDQIYNFNINCKFNYENKNYEEIKQFLDSINIDVITTNKIMFLNFGSFNEFLLADDDLFKKLDIDDNTIHFIKNKINEKVYINSIEL
tara:strand:- start:3 stop:434 length:432 start_codon:yes stop_codon:yes gene_type:complete